MHIDDEDLVLIYYGEQERAAHLEDCAECAARYTALAADLPRVTDDVPARGEDYGRWTWFRLRPKLARRSGGRWAAMAAVAALVIAAFFGGRYSKEPAPAVASAHPGARVFRASLGAHLERSQLVLREIENAPDEPETDFSGEQQRAEGLLTANRLYRQQAVSEGDDTTAQVLEDLERILLEVAHSPARVSSDELGEIRRRIREQGITFRVKVEEVQQEVLEQ